ncbi:MAG: hypothetical protein COA42_03520 [Alteromonadaceae bacterium]|nr:MAG: hypothetical protein COA42_03520 [Alteromonadaceae bacterium]
MKKQEIPSKYRKLDQQALDWLVRLQSPELDKASEAEFFQWLAKSPGHQAAYIKAESLWQRGAVMSQVRVPEAKAAPWRILGIARAWFDLTGLQQGGVFASVCVAGMVLFASVQYGSSNPMEFESYQTAYGEQREVTLSDGSIILLNTDTSVSVSYSDDLRQISLNRGEAFFDVESDAERPFDVLVPSGVIRVLGTQFGVRRSHEYTTVTVIKGRVGLDAQLDAPAGEKQVYQADLTLQANQRFVLEAADENAVPETIDASSILAWREKRLIYRGDSLSNVVVDLDRYFEENIRLADASIAMMEVVAIIQLNDVDVTVAALAASLNLDVTRSLDGKTISLSAASEAEAE